MLNDIEEVKTFSLGPFSLKELWFFIIPIRTCINSVGKILSNQIVFAPSSEVIPFSKYLSFHLGVVLVHAKWANITIVVH